MVWFFVFILIVVIVVLIIVLSHKCTECHVSNNKNYIEIQRKLKEIADLKTTIEQVTENNKKCNIEIENLRQERYKLLRSYISLRGQDEILVDEDIAKTICLDFERLGSKIVTNTNYIASAMADFYTVKIRDIENNLIKDGQIVRSDKIADVRKYAAQLIYRAKKCQYAFEEALINILREHPEIKQSDIIDRYGVSFDELEDITKSKKYKETISKNAELETKCRLLEYENLNYNKKNKDCILRISELESECNRLQQSFLDCEEFNSKRWITFQNTIDDYKKIFSSNLTAIPYMSRFIAEIETVDIARLAWLLSWGNNQEHQKKVVSLMCLRAETQQSIEKYKIYEYQLAYLLELYPNLQDVIDAEFRDLEIDFEKVSEVDPIQRYITHDEWESLTEIERNQLALDRYVESRKKSKWQIGRDYELYCGYYYEQNGFEVEYTGSYYGVDDLGRDLIAKKNDDIYIIQCKYWSSNKLIHEKHIMQLYGSIVEYNLKENSNAKGILVTNIELSERAKQFADALGIMYDEKVLIGNFSRIKCNIGVDESGYKTKIYHLPFDQQYDRTKITKEGEVMAFTVQEAVNLGFRRAFRHCYDGFGNGDSRQ